MSILLWVVVVPLAMLLIGALFQTIGSAIDRRRYPAPGRLVLAQGSRLHVYSEGEGEPTIILESGIAASSLNWRAVQAELAQFTRVISYDRVGFGWSEAARTPRTIDNLVSELEKMLDSLEISGPLILVAHSFGSLIARAYSYRNPDRVAGLLLLDPIDCEHWRTLRPEGKEQLIIGARLSRRGAWLARVGAVRISLMLLSAGARTLPKWIARMASDGGESVISRVTAEVSKMPRELLPVVRAHWSRPQSFVTLAQYLSRLTRCVNEIPYTSLGHLSLMVISAENATESEQREHRKVASLSNRGQHVIAERSGHWIQLDRPDLVVSSLQRSYGLSRKPSVPFPLEVMPNLVSERFRSVRWSPARYSGKVEYAQARRIRERNTTLYRLAHWPLWIWVFFLVPGPLTFTLFARGFGGGNLAWLAVVLAGTGVAGLRGRLPGVEPRPYILRFDEAKPNPLYRRVCYTFAWNAVLSFALLNLSGLAIAAATGSWYMKQIYHYAYLPVCGAVLLLGAVGALPRVGLSTKGEGTERRYFYGSVWAVTVAQTLLLGLWQILPPTRTGNVVKLVVFVGAMLVMALAAYRGMLPRTRPIVPGTLAVAD